MANTQMPLLFFAPLPNTDPLSVAESLMAGQSSAPVNPLDPQRILQTLRAQRGFARLKISLPVFSFDSPRTESAFDGTALETHIDVRFYGDFQELAERVFKVLSAEGLTCYSVWDKRLIEAWPKWEELEVDKGFGTRMSQVLQREEQRLRDTEPDAKRRAQLLSTFLKSAEFRVAMAKEARLEKPGGNRVKKAYSDVVNCYVHWRDGHPSASELGALRKLDPKYASMSIVELRRSIGDSSRFLVLKGTHPHQAAALRSSATKHGVLIDIEPP